jgi:hypothetical protein
MNATRPFTSAGSRRKGGMPDAGNPLTITFRSAASVAARRSGPRRRSMLATPAPVGPWQVEQFAAYTFAPMAISSAEYCGG